MHASHSFQISCGNLLLIQGNSPFDKTENFLWARYYDLYHLGDNICEFLILYQPISWYTSVMYISLCSLRTHFTGGRPCTALRVNSVQFHFPLFSIVFCIYTEVILDRFSCICGYFLLHTLTHFKGTWISGLKRSFILFPLFDIGRLLNNKTSRGSARWLSPIFTFLVLPVIVLGQIYLV